MTWDAKVAQARQLDTTAPVLVLGCPAAAFGKATVLAARIPSRELGIVNTAKGPQLPAWLAPIMHGHASHQIIIDGIDTIDSEDQNKFYELLKYHMISGVKLPHDCTVLVLASDLKNVAENILRLCLVVD